MATQKKISSSKRRTAAHKGVATRRRKELTDKLKADLKATREALKSAKAEAREELKLAKAAAKAEVTVLKDQLNAALKREKELQRISEQKLKMMWASGQKWEKEQMARLKKLFKKKGGQTA